MSSRRCDCLPGLESSTIGTVVDAVNDDDELKDADKDNDSVNRIVDKVVEIVAPVVIRLGVSGILGFCTGYAFKRLGDQAAFGIGCVFGLSQTCAYFGWITINYGNIGRSILRLFDSDGDGKITSKDVKVHVRNLFHVLTFGLPSSASFVYGFTLGLGIPITFKRTI